MKEYTHEDYLRLETEFKQKEAAMQERLWVDSNVGKVDDLLRSHYNKSVNGFGEIVIEHLAKITNAYHGIFYIVNNNEKAVEAIAGFACKVDMLEQKKLAFGETIVGQSVVSKETIKFTDIPTHSIQSRSLVGQLSPHTAIVLPLLFNDVAHGVIELVYVTALEARLEQLLGRVAQNIAAMLESILNNAKMQDLLIEAQQQKEALVSQEEELRQNLEELTATREAQDSAQKELELLKENLEKEVAKQTQKLEESVQRFNLTIETTTEGIWDSVIPEDLVINEDSYFWWSDNFRHMLGFAGEEDFPSRLDSWGNLLYPDHKERVHQAFTAHLMDFTGQTPYDMEYQLKRKTGEYRWYRAIGNVLRDENGKPLRSTGSLIDIQGSKDLEELQKELVQRFDLVVQTTSEGIWDMTLPENLEVDPETPMWFSNRLKRNLGFEPTEEDFPNKVVSWIKVLHPDYVEPIIMAFKKHLMDFTGNTPYDVEYPVVHKDGEVHWYRAVGKVIRSKEGKPLRSVGSMIDIHDKKERVDSNEIFELYSRVSTDGFWYSRPNGKLQSDPSDFAFWSLSFRKQLGFESGDEFPNRVDSWSNRIHPEDVERVFEEAKVFFEDRTGEMLFDSTYRLKNKKGEYIWFNAKGFAIRNDKGLPLRVAGIFSPIDQPEPEITKS